MIRASQKLLLSAMLLLISGCHGTENQNAEVALPTETTMLASPPEITSEEEVEGFHDLVFFIETEQHSKSSAQTLRAMGRHGSEKVGFEVELSPKWDITNDKYFPSKGSITFKRTGAESDTFVRVLDELYGTKLAPKMMQECVKFAAITLEGVPSELSKGAVKIKLFFNPDHPDRYAEIYLNIDLKNRKLWLPEKDNEYRPNIIKALGKN